MLQGWESDLIFFVVGRVEETTHECKQWLTLDRVVEKLIITTA